MTEHALPEESIFLEAVRIESAEMRAAYLDRACADNQRLRREVESLLRANEESGDLLDVPDAIGNTVDLAIAEGPGKQIGPYKLLQQIGEGGMGVVYMAEQSRPVKRRVALKIIKPGMDSRQVIARFEAERQALALMDHPNIARVLDAATTESGRPYFVMELVKGVPITTFCDEQHCTPKERLALFIPICRAVQHAHQKGIIHRDLKPSNVLVALYDGQPVPKVIDFGVAKATSQQLTEKTMFTQLGQVVGTLEYMSPEQAQLNQLDIDTRCDIYSLGVLLYELLTGATPFDRQRLRSAAFDEMMRIIREEEPPRPSVRLSSIETLAAIASNRRTEPRRLRTLVRGELDWIVMKALEKDRARRYETANGLAADIQHYLDGESVVACPPSASYRFRKFARRNMAVLAIAGIITATLLSGLIGTTSQWLRAESAAEQAKRQAGRALRAEQAATRERDVARRQRDENRRLLYASEMIAAQQAWQTANLRRVTDLLDRYKDVKADEEDLRGFAWYYLWGLCQRGLEAATLEAHNGYVWGVAFSPDGKTLATASIDGTVRIWDVQTCKERHTLTHTGGALSVCFSPDGATLASAGRGGAVKLWDTETGKLIRAMETQNNPAIVGVAISSTGKLLAGCYNGTLQLGDLAAGELQTIWGEPQGPRVWSVAFSPDGNHLAFGIEDGAVWLGDVNNREDWVTLDGHTSWARSVAFSPDGKYLASASHDHTAKLWDAVTGEERFTFPHRDRAWSVAFSPDGKTLATTSNTVKLWNVDTGRQLDTLIGHEQTVYAVAFSSDGILASGSHDTTVKLWDLTSSVVPDTLTSHLGNVMDLAASRDGRILASGSEDGTVKLWDVMLGKELRSLPGHSNWVWCVALDRDDRKLASAGDDGTIKLWDVQTGTELDVRFKSLTEGIIDLAFSPDGKTLAGACHDSAVRIWNVQTGEVMAKFSGHSQIVWAVAFSPDGKTLASGSDDATVKLWDIESERELITLAGHTSVVYSVAFSPDGQTLASGSADGTVKLWNVETSAVRERITGHTGPVWSVAFSPDGKTLASSSKDATIRLWDLVGNREPETLIGHTSTVTSVLFTHNGSTLVSGSNDRTVKLWKRASEQEVQSASR